MSLEPYSPCPCESGKKLKFCCADIATEMLKALQLHEGGQTRAARKILEKLHQEQPARAWVSTSYAGVLLSMEEPEAAREALKELLEENPQHPIGRILDATAALDLEGYDQARPSIHRAFTKGVKDHPEMIGSLAAGVSSVLLDEGRYMASRQHLAFALRFVQAQDREQVIMRLLEFDSDQSIPYLLRSVHNLKPLDDLLNEEQQAVFKKSLGLSALGCWHEAAAVLTPLTQEYPDSANLWNNIALFHAWDGNEEAAAEIFHRVGRLAEDRQQAISCETLGQLLDHESNPSVYRRYYYACEKRAVSHLLSKLDEVPRFVRQSHPQEQKVDGSVNFYQILDREPGEGKITRPIDFGKIPKFIGMFTLFEGPEDKVYCRLSAQQECADEVRQYLEEIVGDSIEVATIENEQGEELHASSVEERGWREYQKLEEFFFFDNDLYECSLSELEREKWDYFIGQLWPDTPFSALNNKTPLEAADDDELVIPLAAAVNIFDVFADQFDYQLDTDALRERLGLEKEEPFEIEDDAQLNSCEVLEMLRIPLEKLTDEQLEQVLRRSQLIQHTRFTDQVIEAALKREGVIDEKHVPQALQTYIEAAVRTFKNDVALERVQLAREWTAKTNQKTFKMLQWDLQELRIRLDNPQDPELIPLLNRMHQQYLRKMPEMESTVAALLLMNNMTPPWLGGNIITPDGSPGTGEIWNPEKEAEASSSGKLWLPGQE